MGRLAIPGPGTVVANALTALPIPPVSNNFAYVAAWNAGHAGSIQSAHPEGELELWAASTVGLTLARLYGAVLRPQVLADDDIDTVDFANNELDITSHAYATGDGPIRLTTATTLPAGLALATDYYVIAVNSGSIKLASSFANAMVGTAVAFTDAGTGTHTISDTAETERMRWMSYGFLGDAQDGAISLTAFNGWSCRFRHKPDVVAYAIGATLSSAVAISARVQSVNRY